MAGSDDGKVLLKGNKSCIVCAERFNCPYPNLLGVGVGEKKKAERIGNVCTRFLNDARGYGFYPVLIRVCDLKG